MKFQLILFMLIISTVSNLSFVNNVGRKPFVAYWTAFFLPAVASIIFVRGL